MKIESRNLPTVKRLMEENRCKAFDLVLHDGVVINDGSTRSPECAENDLEFLHSSLQLRSWRREEILLPESTGLESIILFSNVFNSYLTKLRWKHHTPDRM